MRERDLQHLEFHKILDRVAQHTSFSAGQERAFALRPSVDPIEVETWQRETTEARALLDTHPSLNLGGVHDVRPLVKNARKGMILAPEELLHIRDTLTKARSLKRSITRLYNQCPTLANIVGMIEECAHVAAEISRCINDRAEVDDGASPALRQIRQDLRAAHQRLLDRLRHIISVPENAGFLQENIITQRHGRYVIPLKSDFKGRIPGLIHDESSSGATLFIEPLATVELNNTLRELQLEEQREVTRILTNLASLIADEGDFIIRTVGALAQLDLAFAKANYSLEIRGVQPQFAPWGRPTVLQKEGPGLTQVLHPGSTIRLIKARHPLLPPETVVPINVHLNTEERFFIILITGPNTGGKTVSLKTVGLLACMAQAGLHIPAEEGSTLSVFDGIYADIGDEQSIEQNLSTFSSHLGNIIEILEKAYRRSLVLIDEIGAGTDPVEGSALARAILKHLLERGITTIATTHYSDLKVFAQVTPGVVNASVEFDLETLSPTYELNIGLPGRSNALAIAHRLGLPASILADARLFISPTTLETEDLLADLKETQRQTTADRAIAKELREQLELQVRELQERLATAEEEGRRLVEAAREQAQQELQLVRREVARIREVLRQVPTQATAIGEATQILSDLESHIERMRPVESTSPLPVEDIRVGDKVWVTNLGTHGEVVSVSNGRVEVQVGQFRVTVDRKGVRHLKEEAELEKPARELHPRVTSARRTTPPIELDLRGWRVEDALIHLERYLDEAYLGGLPWVRIIHGKGTGALRKAVRETLSMHPLVDSFRSGELNEGGDGITLVNLVKGK